MKTHAATAYTERRIDIQGDGFYVYEWGTKSAEVPSVVLAHATGFHGRCWLRAVACMPQSWHVVAIDSRGHGQSSEAGAVSWQQFSGFRSASNARQSSGEDTRYDHNTGLLKTLEHTA
ncbi:MAG: hypothetical protein AAF529_17015, partial [Pseudomonadota bacterium]